jgi:hypothetical protein
MLPTNRFRTTRVKLGKARCEHNESGLAQKAEVVGTLSHFRAGPKAEVASVRTNCLRIINAMRASLLCEAKRP